MSSVTTPSESQTPAQDDPFACNACLRPLKLFEAYVPDLRALYRLIRGTDVQRNHPLTERELAAFTRCKKHAGPGSRQYLQEEMGVEKMYALRGTLEVMTRWREHNARALARQRTKSERLARRKSPMNQLFNTVRLDQSERPRPKHRGPRPPRAKPHTGPKRYGDEHRPSAEPKTTKKSKRKDEQKGKQKGRH